MDRFGRRFSDGDNFTVYEDPPSPPNAAMGMLNLNAPPPPPPTRAVLKKITNTAPVPSPAAVAAAARSVRVMRGGRAYKVHQGPKGGRYIVTQGKKIYIHSK